MKVKICPICGGEVYQDWNGKWYCAEEITYHNYWREVIPLATPLVDTHPRNPVENNELVTPQEKR